MVSGPAGAGDAAQIAADLARLQKQAEDANFSVLAYLIHCAMLEALQNAKGPWKPS